MSLQLNVNLVKLAECILNGGNFVQKVQNTITHLETEGPKIKSQSPQITQFMSTVKSEFSDLDVIKRKLKNIVSALDAKKAEMQKLEGSDQIFAAAKASLTKTSGATKTKLSR